MSDQWKTPFKKGQEVYLNAFLKESKNRFYVCKGTVLEVPKKDTRQVFKVRITEVGSTAVGSSKEESKQSRLINLICTKNSKELQAELPSWISPSLWLVKSKKK